MKNLYRFIFAIGLLITLTSSFALPPCQGSYSSKWNNCYGTHTVEDSTYAGDWQNGRRSGQGTSVWLNGEKYVGSWQNDQMNGQGSYSHASGNKYVGEYKNNKRNGHGTFIFSNGDKYVGEYKDNVRNGQGSFIYPNGQKYVGQFKDGKSNGLGAEYFPSGDQYVGEFVDDKFNGQGTFLLASGDKYVGEFKDGKRNGRGIFYLTSGSISQAGIWNDDTLASSQYVDPNSFTRIVKGNSAPSAAEAQRLENERKAAQLDENLKRMEEEKRQVALERQRIESQKTQTQIAPDNRRRLALVIGNDNYSSMPRLNNAVNDAKSMTDALRQANFEVMSYSNLDKRRMEEVLRNFTGKLGRDDVGLFYFSGHGIQADNRNFLIPVAENVKKTSEVPYEGIDVNRVMDNLKDAKNALNIVVLDACRSSLPDSRGGLSRGLTVTDAPQGSIIAYATSPGKTASDGDGGNSPYTKNLVRAMQRKGVKIEDVFKEVRQSVIRDTNGEQTPSETSYLVGDFYFRP